MCVCVCITHTHTHHVYMGADAKAMSQNILAGRVQESSGMRGQVAKDGSVCLTGTVLSHCQKRPNTKQKRPRICVLYRYSVVSMCY